jgi:hypothetical protein
MRSLGWVVAAASLACNSTPSGGGNVAPYGDGGTGAGMDSGQPSSGGPDAGTGAGSDAGSNYDGGNGSGGGGGGSDGGVTANDCDGLGPGALPAMITYQTTVDYSSPHGVCQLAIGNGDGFVAHEVSTMGLPRWTILTPSGAVNGTFSEGQHGEAAPTAAGFVGYEGPNALPGQGGPGIPPVADVKAWDERGQVIGTTPLYGSGVFASDPRGGLLAVGRFSATNTSPAPADTMVEMFNADASVRWGPVALGSDATVFGAGVDLLGRALVVLDGGSGNIDAIWIDEHGAAKTAVFRVLSGFSAGVSTWFETSPLIGSGLALRRMDAPATGDERRSSRWLGILPSGTASLQAAPDWLASRPDTNMELARSGRAYAFTPWAADASVCDQQVEIVSPAGSSCGKADFAVDGSACTTRELRLGLDGTVMQMLPNSREQNTPPGSAVYTCTLRYWPAALR